MPRGNACYKAKEAMVKTSKTHTPQDKAACSRAEASKAGTSKVVSSKAAMINKAEVMDSQVQEGVTAHQASKAAMINKAVMVNRVKEVVLLGSRAVQGSTSCNKTERAIGRTCGSVLP